MACATELLKKLLPFYFFFIFCVIITVKCFLLIKYKYGKTYFLFQPYLYKRFIYLYNQYFPLTAFKTTYSKINSQTQKSIPR